jgi:hypothetical protein
MSLTFLVMQGLRGQLEIQIVHTRSGLPVRLLDLYGEVRAAELAHPAADAELGALRKSLPVPEDEDVGGTIGHANSATLAISLPQDVDVGFLGLVAHRLK